MTSETILGPEQVGDAEFDCILNIPGEGAGRGAVVQLRDARWTHRGRWHLTGRLHGAADDLELLLAADRVEIVYPDKASEQVRFVRTDVALRFEITGDRLSAYTHGPVRYPRGRSLERRVGMEVDFGVVPVLHKILNDYLPGIVDDQRRTWIVAALLKWRTHEMANATNQLARQLADEIDARATLRRKIADVIAVWEPDVPDDPDDYVRARLYDLERILDCDEKGLPL